MEIKIKTKIWDDKKEEVYGKLMTLWMICLGSLFLSHFFSQKVFIIFAILNTILYAIVQNSLNKWGVHDKENRKTVSKTESDP